MSKYFLILFWIFSYNLNAEVTHFNLKINPIDKDDFSRPLPEIAVFTSSEKCIFHKFGFDSDLSLHDDLDTVFAIPNNNLPNNLDREKIEQMLEKKHPDLAKLPKEEKSKIIDSVAQQIKSQMKIVPCDLDFRKISSKFLNFDNQVYAHKSVDINIYIIVEYTAEWCLPCKKQADALNQYLESRKISAVWLKVERDAQKI